jgi:hypothetical protein
LAKKKKKKKETKKRRSSAWSAAQKIGLSGEILSIKWKMLTLKTQINLGGETESPVG